MTLFRESLLCQLCTLLLSAYEASALHRLLSRVGAWCSRQVRDSFFLSPLYQEGTVSDAWPDSLLCRLLSFLVDLPARLLRWIYALLEPILEDSFFARLAFTLGDETAIAESWFIMLLWVIPFDYWNNAYTLLAFAFLLLLFHAGAMRRAERRLDLKSIGFYPLVLFGSMFLAAAFSYSRSLSIRFLFFHISAAICVLVTVSAVRHIGDLKRLLAGASFAVLVSSLYGILQRLQGLEVNIAYVDANLNEDMPSRVFSFYDNPNTFAEVLIMLLPLVLALILCSKRSISRAAACGVFAVGLAALGMTYSRASWVGGTFALVVLVFFWKPKLLPLLIVAGCLAMPLLPSSVLNRLLTITNMSDTTTSSRFPLYEAAVRLIGRSPLVGAGLGIDAVQDYIKRYYLYKGAAPFVHAHNIYLELWIEAGLLGIVSFIAAMLWNIKRAFRTARRCGSPAARTITFTAAASLCGIMVAGLADYPWNYPRVMCIFFFVFAVALSGVKLCLEGGEEE